MNINEILKQFGEPIGTRAPLPNFEHKPTSNLKLVLTGAVIALAFVGLVLLIKEFRRKEEPLSEKYKYTPPVNPNYRSHQSSSTLSQDSPPWDTMEQQEMEIREKAKPSVPPVKPKVSEQKKG